MSKLIVEMEMPRDCWCCPNGHPDWIYNDDGAAQMVCFCNICNTEEDNRWISETETDRPSWCPIKGVLPDEHGDLIDRDALLEKYNKKGVNIAECLTDERTAKAFEKFCIIADAVEAAEAVIAAERKDNGK